MKTQSEGADTAECQRQTPTDLPSGKTRYWYCWMGLGAGVDGCGQSCHHRDSIPLPPSTYLLAVTTAPPRPQLFDVENPTTATSAFN